MDLEQLIKRVEWLDEERRADKTTISALQQRTVTLEGLLEKTNAELKTFSTELSELRPVAERIGKFEDSITSYRIDVQKSLDTQEERAKARELTVQKRQDEEISEIRERAGKVEHRMDAIDEIRSEFLDLKEKFTRLERVQAEEREKQVVISGKADEALLTVQQALTEQRQESRRIMDIQGEVSALRKRADESKVKLQLVSDDQIKQEVRITDIASKEAERREAQTVYIDRLTSSQADQERNWKTWQKTFLDVEKQANEVHTLLQNMGDTERAVKQAQADFDEITDQIKRRINEITEMQRLGEERFRQEWATFKADDQKRWTNYALTQEEIQRESGRQLDRLGDQATGLEENLQELQDIVQFLSDHNEKVLQSLLGNLRDWVADNDSFMKSVR